MACAVARFSGRIKHATASWREIIIGIERDGLRSQVCKRERPKVVLVLSRIPTTRENDEAMIENVSSEAVIPKSDSPSLVLSE